jgi:predicted amidohydrolase
VNRVGRDNTLAYSGRSVVIDPRGRILADAGGAEGVIGATLELELLQAYRGGFPALGDMRFEPSPRPTPLRDQA